VKECGIQILVSISGLNTLTRSISEADIKGKDIRFHNPFSLESLRCLEVSCSGHSIYFLKGVSSVTYGLRVGGTRKSEVNYSTRKLPASPPPSPCLQVCTGL
jgi:hypothetical protein